MDRYIKQEVMDKLNVSDEWLSHAKQSQSSSKPTIKVILREKKKFKVDKSPSLSLSVTKDCKTVLRKLCSPVFQKKYKSISLQSFDKETDVKNLKKNGKVLRNSEARAKFMHGFDCRCCAPYYDALGLSTKEREERVNQISRHRDFEPILSTPDRYWDIKFPTTEKQKSLGLVECVSPLFKNTKRLVSTIKPRAKRKIISD